MYYKNKLIIYKCLDRRGLLAMMRSFYPYRTMIEIRDIVDNLPFEDVDFTKSISSLLNVAEFEIHRIPTAGQRDYPTIPPWETPEYLQAVAWYDSLSPEDKQKINLLRQGSGPSAW